MPRKIYQPFDIAPGAPTPKIVARRPSLIYWRAKHGRCRARMDHAGMLPSAAYLRTLVEEPDIYPPQGMSTAATLCTLKPWTYFGMHIAAALARPWSLPASAFRINIQKLPPQQLKGLVQKLRKPCPQGVARKLSNWQLDRSLSPYVKLICYKHR